MPTLCRDCLTSWDNPTPPPCPTCGGARILSHPELASLTFAHIDCDAFFAAVEKRDNPALIDRPVVIGSGERGVVATACYIARRYGVRSAMPLYRAKKLCPQAAFIAPAMGKYSAVSKQIRKLFYDITPLVEPLSIDEAFLDMAGTEGLYGGLPARALAGLQQEVEKTLGLTLSIGLSYNKFLAKVASDLQKPRGFAVLGRAEALDFLAPQPVSLIWGVGKSLALKLQGDGIHRIGELRGFTRDFLMTRYGKVGARLHDFAHGIDSREIKPAEARKSLSAETTFTRDLSTKAELLAALWPLCEKVASGLRREGLRGTRVTLKLKQADFRLLTRSKTLGEPTNLAEVIYQTGKALLEKEPQSGRRYRLIGIGLDGFHDTGDLFGDLLEAGTEKTLQIELTLDELRARFGPQAIVKGRKFVPGRK